MYFNNYLFKKRVYSRVFIEIVKLILEQIGGLGADMVEGNHILTSIYVINQRNEQFPITHQYHAGQMSYY